MSVEELPNNDQSAPLRNQSKVIEVADEMTQPNQEGFFADVTSSQAAVSVRVALRIRPLNAREVHENSKVCVEATSNTVTIGKDRSFTFDKAFDIEQGQESVFDSCVKNLVLGCFAGFNATVLAYGQTGSGKTFTMGTELSIGVQESDLGIIPRVIRLIFDEEQKRKHVADLTIKCSFLEIYNEELVDLLDQQLIEKMIPLKKDISIREEKNGSISVHGLNEVTVKSGREMGNCLNMGSHARRTASTLMNQESSRSHGIFTVTIEQRVLLTQGEETQDDKAPEVTVAKFHFVDLAGSERAKKTGATGSTLKEGIMINKSLLALGNVISALTDERQKSHHIPYRDSKLTRILQDSLGGNSRTSMIACCSPAETSFEETLNTLKYASRARNIKNKPTINRDPATQQIIDLKQQVLILQKEIFSQRKMLSLNNIEFESEIEIPDDLDLRQKPQQSVVQSTQLSQESSRQLEQMIKDLRKQIQQKDQLIQTLQLKSQEFKQHSDQLQINQLDNLKQRDEARLVTEQLTARLSELGHPVFIIDTKPSVVDEYRLQSLQLDMECQSLRSQLQHLQIDNQQLIEQSTRDLSSLEQKQVEIEQYKRASLQWQTELEKTVSKGGKTSYQRRNTVQYNSPQKSQQQSKEWLSSELDHKIKHFDEIRQQFIDNLGTQVSQIMGGISPVKQHSSKSLTITNTEQSVIELPITEEAQDPSNVDYSSSSESNSLSDNSVIKLDTQEDDSVIKLNSPQHSHHKPDLQESQFKIINLDTQLKDKEQLLTQFKQSQIELQDNLLQAMKQQYHLKVDQLSTQLIKLESQKVIEMKKFPSLGQKSKVEDFTRQQKELQQQLTLMAKKDRDTKLLQKSLDDQQKKTKVLQSDLDKLKTQKVIMMKKVKDDQEKLLKYKQDKLKELQNLKTNLFKKEKENSELKRNQVKVSSIAKRKQEELMAVQQRQKLDIQKRQGYKEQKLQLKQVDLEAIKQWVIDNVLRMVQFQELQQERDSKESELAQLETDIKEFIMQQAKVAVQLEKCLDPEDQPDLQSQHQELKEQIDILDSRQHFIESSQLILIKQLTQLQPEPIDSKVMNSIQNLDGARGCISIFFQLLLESRLMSNRLKKDSDLVKSEINDTQIELQIQKQLTEKKDQFYQESIKEMQLQYSQRDKMWFSAIQEKLQVDTSGIEEGDLKSLFQVCFQKAFHSQTLQRPAQSKLEVKSQKTELVNQTKLALSRQIAELEKKLLFQESHNVKLQLEQQQTVRDKLKIRKQLDDEKAKSKKMSLLQTSTEEYTNTFLGSQQTSLVAQTSQVPTLRQMNSALAISKPLSTAPVKVDRPSLADIRNARKSKKTTEDQFAEIEAQALTIQSLNTDVDVFNRLQNSSASKDQSARRSFRQKSRTSSVTNFNEEVEQENYKWQIMSDKLDAHKTQVYSLASMDNKLYSGANKSLKIWDIEYMESVAQIQADIGIIKAIKICKQRKLIIAASGSSVVMWDLGSFAKVGEFKGNNEIKCLELVQNGDLLFAGTKGTPTTGALLIFDLRKQAMQPVDEKEKNGDIFSITSTNEYVFTGNRNHQVNPFSLKQWQTMPPLQAPHFDAVSSLTILKNNVLVSGGKDKNLRIYKTSATQVSYQGPINNAHTDQINCLASDQISMFSGGKDGMVKVWRQDYYGDLKCHAKLDGNATRGSVNDLTTLDPKYGQAFASANADKSIRIWQMSGAEDIGNSRSRDWVERPMAPILTQGSALSQLQISLQKSKD